MTHELDYWDHDFRYNGDTLIIYCTREKQKELHYERRLAPELFGTDRALRDEFEEMIANSELEWVYPEDTHDLTEAPMLGVLGTEEPGVWGQYGRVLIGMWGGQSWFAPIEQRWGYEPYQIRSPLDDLADKGRAVFKSRW